MDLNTLLPHLRNVYSVGNNEFIACCPSHDSLIPELRIHITNEGLVGLKCISGCHLTDIFKDLELPFPYITGVPEAVNYE